jgi:hypothetical protein
VLETELEELRREDSSGESGHYQRMQAVLKEIVTHKAKLDKIVQQDRIAESESVSAEEAHDERPTWQGYGTTP